MGIMKELYISMLEKRQAQLIDAGLSDDEAYRIAGEAAVDMVKEHLADRADHLRMKKKEGF